MYVLNVDIHLAFLPVQSFKIVNQICISYFLEYLFSLLLIKASVLWSWVTIRCELQDGIITLQKMQSNNG